MRYLVLESMCILVSFEFFYEAVKTYIEIVINVLKVSVSFVGVFYYYGECCYLLSVGIFVICVVCLWWV